MNQTHSTEITLPCPDLAEAVEFFTTRLGFRIEMVMPADRPAIASVSGHGMKIRLSAAADDIPAESAPDAAVPIKILVNSRNIENSNSWSVGRAGMLYRDLISGRLGGRLIASHILIPDGGEVRDYVHYHKVQFQMIYCKAGWVRVVYEDQGDPFILKPGDCVLQPPEIRHRVLESSSGLEVIEISSPAAHPTYADYEIQLPSPGFRPERIFSKQRFLRHCADQARWSLLEGGFEFREIGVAEATGGLAAARVVRSTTTGISITNANINAASFLVVLKGGLEIRGDRHEQYHLIEGDSAMIPIGLQYGLQGTEGLEFLEVLFPDGVLQSNESTLSHWL